MQIFWSIVLRAHIQWTLPVSYSLILRYGLVYFYCIFQIVCPACLFVYIFQFTLLFLFIFPEFHFYLSIFYTFPAMDFTVYMLAQLRNLHIRYFLQKKLSCKLNLASPDRWAENSPLFLSGLQSDFITTEESHTSKETNLEINIPIKIWVSDRRPNHNRQVEQKIPQFIF